MTKTVLTHFYNEEYLLPWWLSHHKKIFDHGILIDYHSTDRSREIIKAICPTWEIITTRNEYFESLAIDQEIMDYERNLTGWRITLNIPEFLFGNISRLSQTPNQQIFLGNYVFIDKDGATPDINKPLHEQCCWGYYQGSEGCQYLNLGSRCTRSLHNYPVVYEAGRHWGAHQATYNDLAIFYYGYAFLNRPFLDRKLQIKTKMSPIELQVAGNSHPNTVTEKQFLDNINSYHRPRCSDLLETIKLFL